MHRLHTLRIACILLLVLCAACGQEDKSAAQRDGYVEATDAYVQSFGNPPQGKEGRAYARVAYLPLADDPQRMRALPVYLFSEGYHLPKILERLVSRDLLLPEDSDLYKPFPDDLEMTVEPPAEGLQQISLTTRQSWSSAERAAAARAFAETALQFVAVRRVEVLVNNEPVASMPQGGFTHNPASIADVGNPNLVLIAAAWESGNEQPTELMVEFDRPINVGSFKLFGPSGDKVDGDYYTSIFQMAVIVHPKEPGQFQEGTMMRAEWDVVDTLGRSSRGVKTLPLHRYDH